METDPDTADPIFILVSCPVEYRPDGSLRLYGELEITLSPDSLAYRIYNRDRIYEPFQCNYELNPEYLDRLRESGIRVSGTTGDGGTRIVELSGHRFYVGTGFVPQLISTEDNPHPLITAFLEAAAGYGR